MILVFKQLHQVSESTDEDSDTSDEDPESGDEESDSTDEAAAASSGGCSFIPARL